MSKYEWTIIGVNICIIGECYGQMDFKTLLYGADQDGEFHGFLMSEDPFNDTDNEEIMLAVTDIPGSRCGFTLDIDNRQIKLTFPPDTILCHSEEMEVTLGYVEQLSTDVPLTRNYKLRGDTSEKYPVVSIDLLTTGATCHLVLAKYPDITSPKAIVSDTKVRTTIEFNRLVSEQEALIWFLENYETNTDPRYIKLFSVNLPFAESEERIEFAEYCDSWIFETDDVVRPKSTMED